MIVLSWKKGLEWVKRAVKCSGAVVTSSAARQSTAWLGGRLVSVCALPTGRYNS